MAGEAVAALQSILTVQSLFNSFEALQFGAYLCPVDTPIETIQSTNYDVIIVGSGTAGSVLAYRLSVCSKLKVLLIEAGGCPPFQTIFLGEFVYIPRSKYDYNRTAVNDNYTCQNLQDKSADMTAGKMFGGTSQLQHNLRVQGSPDDYDTWAKFAKDPSWSYKYLLKYFKKTEDLQSKTILEDYPAYHSKCGPVKTTQQVDCLDKPILKSFSEIGYKIRTDTNNDDPLGVVEPLLDNDIIRQSGLISYLYKAKKNCNLHVLSNATVTKVIFNDKKVATGVQFNYNGSSYTARGSKEVILSAGAIRSPQLLILSGIGPADHLAELNIPVVSNLPVGKNLHDHVGAAFVVGLEKDSTATPAINPTKFPTALTCAYSNLDNKSANYAQCQSINLLFYQNSPGLMPLCLNVFKYTTDICQSWYDANVDRRVLISIVLITRPFSRGELRLNSTNIEDQPSADIGYLRNKTDLVTLGRCLNDTAQLLKTKYFKDIKADYYDLGLCKQFKKFSAKYWECYSVAMSTTLWHYVGTASLGSVVDTYLQVKGVKHLRVVDASIIPFVPGGNMNTAVQGLAEKAAEEIASKYGCDCV